MKKLLAHIIPWFVFISYMCYTNKEYYPDLTTGFYLLKQFIMVAEIIIIFYLNYCLLVPRLLIHKRRPISFSIAVVFLLCVDVIIFLVLGIILDSLIADQSFYEGRLNGILQHLFTPVLFIGLSTGVRLAQQYYKDRYKKLELEKRLKQAELDTLKAQINPHFLYNAFNSIYALAQSQSEKTADAVLQLSDVMRYVTYSATNPQVSIFEELKFIRTYIEFQKLRITDPNLKIITSIEDPTNDFKICPLLLITFIENAFKHSNLVRLKEPINVHFKSEKDGFTYHVSNEINTAHNESGLGLANLKKILELTYPDTHELKIWTASGIHHAFLKLIITT